jgi:hypothetical protein
LKLLLYFEYALLAAGIVMTVTLGVVCLLFVVNFDAGPEVARDFPNLRVITAAFAVATAGTLLAVTGLRRRSAWRWPAQAALVLVLVACVRVIGLHLGTS